MTCYRPFTGQRGPDGKLAKAIPHGGELLTVPCGTCIGCKLRRNGDWSIRGSHEASQHSENAFITLTYAPENLPARGNLHRKDLSAFLKRLRYSLSPATIRYLACGEYGETYQRPHFHACIFGHTFPDKKLWTVKNGQNLYRSASLEQLWPYGNSVIGDVTQQSTAYVAGYTIKSISDDYAREKFERTDQQTGEIYELNREFNAMSLKPGLGASWFDRYHQELYPSDHVIIKGKPRPIPRYYDKLYEKLNPMAFLEIKARREAHAALHAKDSTPQRLAAREICALAYINRLERPIE